MQHPIRRRAGILGVALIVCALMIGLTGSTASAASTNTYEDSLILYNPCTGSELTAHGMTRTAFSVLGSTGFAVGSVRFIGEAEDFADFYDVTLRGSAFNFVESGEGGYLYFSARGFAMGNFYDDTSFTFWADVYVYESGGQAWAEIYTYNFYCTGGGDNGQVPV